MLNYRTKEFTSTATAVIPGAGLTREQWIKRAVVEGTSWIHIGQAALAMMTIAGVFDADRERE
jgi:hypothetical protein